MNEDERRYTRALLVECERCHKPAMEPCKTIDGEDYVHESRGCEGGAA